MTSPLRFVDRSRVVTDWTCPRRRYWSYEHEGLGVTPKQRPLYFDVGDAVHKALSALTARPTAVDAVVEEVIAAFRLANTSRWEGDDTWKLDEQACLVEGIVRGWHRYVLPRILKDYTLVATEEEFPYKVNDWLTHGVKPDRLLQRKVDQTLWYRETKTAASLGPHWGDQWVRAIQLHATAYMLGSLLGTQVEGMVVEGILKGYDREGKASSIFCYGYTNGGTVRGPEVDYQWRPGRRKAPVWSMRGGVKAWVAAMPNEVLSTQFVESPPVFLQTRLVEAYLRQLEKREAGIAEVMGVLAATTDEVSRQYLLDSGFPQHFSQCHPAFGSKCGDLDLCFNPHVAANPAQGGFVPRVPHHKADPAWALVEKVELAPGTWMGEVEGE